MEDSSLDTIFSEDSFGTFYYSAMNTDLLVSDAKGLVQEFRSGLDRASVNKWSLYELLIGMLDYAAYDEGRRYVASVLHSVPRDEATVVRVAQAWVDNMFLPMMVLCRPRTPAAFSHAPLYDDASSQVETADRTEQNKLREQVIIREGRLCAICKAHDMLYSDYPDTVLASTEPALLDVVHIMPLSFNTTSTAFKDSALTLDMLRHWTGLGTEQLNTSRNAIFMTLSYQSLLGRFKAYFDGSPFPEEPNKYVVRSTDNARLPGVPGSSTVCTFESCGNIQVPSPEYLAIHAAFAKVLHACGAAQQVDKVFNDMEENQVLSSDGGSDIGLYLSSRLITAMS
ncbi:hypothetical protein OE88DRAFT_1115211 [Heliocybe sulcata]|uniref:Uncharacterized protein n=1 Tax=Heliocybe sulcata TaxID=5364 RepID=A0A5C3MJK1_9AGAM|nr:hypothetical protein OE88DRAFT_1115211 [Heliocybe sulcata]